MFFDEVGVSDYFSRMVGDIDTRSGVNIGSVEACVRSYLDGEVIDNKLMQYGVDVRRVGQSVVECDVSYFTVLGVPGSISLSARLSQPSEVTGKIVDYIEKSVVMGERPKRGQQISLWFRY